MSYDCENYEPIREEMGWATMEFNFENLQISLGFGVRSFETVSYVKLKAFLPIKRRNDFDKFISYAV